MKTTFTSLLLSLIFLVYQSCKKERKTEQENLTENKIEKPNDSIKKSDTIDKNNTTFKQKENQEIEVFDVDEMLFNGKSKRFFSLKEFEKNFGKADSIKLMSEEAPCSYIFENEDGKGDDKYLFKNGSRFENSKDKVAIDEFRFYKDNFLKYKNHIFNASTTLEDLRKIFPNAVEAMGEMDVYKEGKLQVIELREDENNISDGHIKVFIKKGELYFMHWWFPC